MTLPDNSLPLTILLRQARTWRKLMRWGKPPPERYAVRVRRRFLWLPVCIDGECKWLERATLMERYEAGEDWGTSWNWRPHKWVEGKDEPQ
jgi:hypothetical protein